MKQHDLERISALLDGCLEAGEQDNLLAEIGQDEDLYEVFTEAARLRTADAKGMDLDTDGDGEGDDNVVRRSFLSRYRMPIAALAAAAVLVLAVGLALRGRGSAPVLDAAFSAGRTGALPDDYTVRGWTVTRGGASVTESSRVSFRIGVHAAGLMAAIGANDSSKAIEELSAIRSHLGRLDLPPQPAEFMADELLQSISAGDLSPEAVRRFLADILTVYADSSYAQLGSWVESQRLQLLSGSPAVAIRTLRIPEGLDSSLGAELTRLQQDLSRPGARTPQDRGSLISRLGRVLARF